MSLSLNPEGNTYVKSSFPLFWSDVQFLCGIKQYNWSKAGREESNPQIKN